MSLTALTGAALTERLVVEPLWFAAELRPSGRYLDVGSGNGSPAVPWHTLCSFDAAHLVESRQRKAAFLRRTAKELGLRAVTVHARRFEDVASEIEAPDWITLQGVRLTPKMLETFRGIASAATRLVWITQAPATPYVAPERMLEVPGTGRRAMVFNLGQRTSPGPCG